MANEATRAALGQVEILFQTGRAVGLSDGRLLERFVMRGVADDVAEAAFAAIVDRHGAMVLRTCRRILGDEHAAQDAAQATFLVLARRARTVAGLESIGGWLYGVALRVASKERVAETRRRLREQRGGTLAAERRAEPRAEVTESELWAGLDEEMGRLPEVFRTPLVLCYLEGLTQEQAAAQLNWPIGTVQSRLARGRAKLKARLIRRGMVPASAAIGVGMTSSLAEAAPAAWSTATLAAALAFTHRSCWAVKAGAGPAAAGLAWEVLREMSTTKVKMTLTVTLIVAAATAMTAIAVAFVEPEPKKDKKALAAQVKATTPEPKSTPALQPTPPAAPEKLTVTGIVRDDQGKPLAKVWVGSDPRPLADEWDNPRPENIRERKEPFRDAQGSVIPPGEVGKYFEVREPNGPWRPVSPDDIRPFEAIVWNGDGPALPKEEVAKTHSPFTVRRSKGGWWMAGMPGVQDASRTDSKGRFSTTFPRHRQMPVKLHFASADYMLQATYDIPPGVNVEEPLDIRLRPTRLIRGRVIEQPRDDPRAYMRWAVYVVGGADRPLSEWCNWMLPNPNSNDPDHVKRHFDVRLPAGKYKIEFSSSTLQRLVDLEVSPGTEPIDQEFRLESFASVRAVGRPALEIDADDLDGLPVKLSEFHGQVVVLDFWGTWCGPCIGAMSRLMEIQKRFHDKPLVILALHDSSIQTTGEYRKAIQPIKERFWKGADLPFRVLIDRPQEGKGTRPYITKPQDKGAGKSGDTYEVMSWPSTFVIDKQGKLVGKFGIDELEGALEDQFGLPRSRPEKNKEADGFGSPKPRRNVRIHGKVVGPEGQPIAGATLVPQTIVVRQKEIKTGADGSYDFIAETILIDHFEMSVRAPGFASRAFRIEAKSSPQQALKLGVGAEVLGRLMRDGKPQADVLISLQQVQRSQGSYLGDLKAKTNAEGRFHFTHVYADQEFDAAVPIGSLADHGAVVPRRFKTGGDGTAVELEDLQVKAGRKLSGRVVFSDGKAIPAKTTALADASGAPGLLRSPLDADGRFEFSGLPEGEVSVSVQFHGINTWDPPGYRLSTKNKCLSPLNPFMIMGRLDHDVDDLIILFEPGPEGRSSSDPGRMADFEEAKAGKITGASIEAISRK